MNIIINENDIIVKGIKCLNLELTLDCGQAFRFRKLDDNSFEGVAGGHYLNICNRGEDLVFKNTDIDVFNNFWVNYFDLNRDYEKICERLKEDSLLNPAVNEYYGIRILNQEPWETLCSFVISQQNNIKRIKLIISRLCERYGDDLGNSNYAFPTAERLSRLTVSDFEALGTGYRAKYLEKLSKDVALGKIDFDKIKNMTLDEARCELLKIYGVGEKVANCVLLFGLGFYDAFPVDVWMKRVMEYYPDGLPECFSGIRGIAQQYLFHWARNNIH